MNKNDEILRKLLNIETTVDNIYKEIIVIKKENESKSLEQFQIMTKVENIAEFVKEKYNVLLEEKEGFQVDESMKNIM